MSVVCTTSSVWGAVACAASGEGELSTQCVPRTKSPPGANLVRGRVRVRVRIRFRVRVRVGLGSGPGFGFGFGFGFGLGLGL